MLATEQKKDPQFSSLREKNKTKEKETMSGLPKMRMCMRVHFMKCQLAKSILYEIY